MANFRIAELNFDDIKTNLKNFLTNYRDKEGNLVFTDYDFEASSLSILLDILAYNTHYNAYYANMVANEMFLDSAVKRESAVSIAKHLGYIPRSFRSARAVVSFEVKDPIDSPATLTLPKFSSFSSVIDGTNFTFVNLDAVVIVPKEGIYSFENVELVEGEPLSYAYRVDVSGPSEKYSIPNKNIDTSTIRITVQKSFTDTTSESYSFADSILDLTSESKIFFLEENPNGFYEVFFGDGVVGKKLEPGNIVTIEYLVSNGSLCNVSPNLRQTFSLGTIIGGGTVNNTIVSTQNSTGGDEPDTLDEIKFKATKFASAAGRAVTAADYKSLIESNFPLVESISVWGGEDNDPPRYGKVMISIKPFDGFVVNDVIKNKIRNSVLADRKVLSIIPEFVDPSYLFLTLNSRIRFNPKNSRYTAEEIKILVENQIRNYFNFELQKFEKEFTYSKVSRLIDAIDTSIVGNTFSFKVQKRIVPVINARNGYSGPSLIKFANKLVAGTLTSTTFYYEINNAIKLVYLKDNVSTGRIDLINFYNSVTEFQNIGTINYVLGTIDIPVFIPTGFVENSTDIRIYAKTEELDVQSTRDMVLDIDDSTQNSLLRRDSGLLVTVVID